MKITVLTTRRDYEFEIEHRKQFRAIIDALERGSYIYCPFEQGTVLIPFHSILEVRYKHDEIKNLNI